MKALVLALAFITTLAIVFRVRSLKEFLILGAVVSAFFRVNYSPIYTEFKGWDSGVTISLSELFLAALWIIPGALGPPVRLRGNLPVQGVLLFTVAILLSMVNSTNTTVSIYLLVFWIKLSFLYFFTVIRMIQNEDDLEILLKAIRVALGVQGCIGLMQFTSGQNFIWFSTGAGSGQTISFESGGSEIIRAIGTIGKPNSFGMLTAGLSMLVLGVALLGGSRARMANVIFGACGLLAAIVSFSRGSWLGIATASLFLLFILVRLGRVPIGSLSKILAAFAVLTIAFLPLLKGRISGDDANSAQSRVELFKIAFEMIRKHPVVGVGANTYTSVMEDYKPADYEQSYVAQVHNMYVYVTAEMGFVGLTAYLMMMFGSLFKGFRTALNDYRGPLARSFSLGVCLFLVHHATHLMVDMANSQVSQSIFLLVTAVAVRCSQPDFAPLETESDTEEFESSKTETSYARI